MGLLSRPILHPILVHPGADERVCSNRVISKQQNLLQRPASLEMGVNRDFRKVSLRSVC
jgi:hypothetical protein